MAKDNFIRLRVSQKEKERITAMADAAHLSVSEFARRSMRNRDIVVVEGVDELLRELRHQGNNLNQLTLLARQGHIEVVNLNQFLEVYERTWQALSSLLSQVE